MAVDPHATGLPKLRLIFGKLDDPYAGADIVLARRSLGLMTLMTSALTALFVALAPPTHSALGWAGLVFAFVVVTGGLRGGRRLISGDFEATWNQMYLWSYMGLGRMLALTWLAGGGAAPYQRLALLTVTTATAVHHARRGAIFLLALVPALGAPLIYGGWSHPVFVDFATNLALSWAAGLLIAAYMLKVRAQRVNMRADEARAQELARVDSLTSLANRRAFDEALAAEIARTRRAGSQLSVVLVDLNGLKKLNDECGHLEGDRALRQVARALDVVMREADRCYRWAGDEFAAILPDTGAEGAAVVRDRIVAQVCSSCFTSYGEALLVTCGVAELGEGDALSLVAAADEDLLTRKAGSRPERFVG